MATTSSLVGHMASPSCKVINGTPMPPVHAPCSKYPGPGPDRVNNSAGNGKLQVMKSTGDYPDNVLPKGSTL